MRRPPRALSPDVEAVVLYLSELLGPELRDRNLWTRVRSIYAGLSEGGRRRAGRNLLQFGEPPSTGHRRCRPDTEFLEFPASGPLARTGPWSSTLPGGDDQRDLIERLLGACGWEVPTATPPATPSSWPRGGCPAPDLGWRGGPLAVDVLRAPFYTEQGAYLVGRIHGADEMVPLVLPLVHGDRGILVDAALLTADEASVVFGFSWSYFFVNAPHPAG